MCFRCAVLKLCESTAGLHAYWSVTSPQLEIDTSVGAVSDVSLPFDRPPSLASADLDGLNGDPCSSPVPPQRKKSAVEKEVDIGTRATSPIEGLEPAPEPLHRSTATASNAITARFMTLLTL